MLTVSIGPPVVGAPARRRRTMMSEYVETGEDGTGDGWRRMREMIDQLRQRLREAILAFQTERDKVRRADRRAADRAGRDAGEGETLGEGLVEANATVDRLGVNTRANAHSMAEGPIAMETEVRRDHRQQIDRLRQERDQAKADRDDALEDQDQAVEELRDAYSSRDEAWAAVEQIQDWTRKCLKSDTAERQKLDDARRRAVFERDEAVRQVEQLREECHAKSDSLSRLEDVARSQREKIGKLEYELETAASEPARRVAALIAERDEAPAAPVDVTDWQPS